MIRYMLSYWYYRRVDMAAVAAESGLPVRMMVDSGAFSAHELRGSSEGVKLADYAAWLTDWWPLITTAINLDVISNPVASARNQLALEERGLPVVPVWHSGSPYAELEALCRDYRYVAVGGPAVSEPRRDLLLAMSAKATLIAREHGTVLHGLGRSGSDDLSAIPWYSVDASSWLHAAFNGNFILYGDGRIERSIRFTRAREHAAALRAHGVDPALITDLSYGRLGSRTDRDQYRIEMHQLKRAAAIAWRRFEAYLRERHRVPPPPGQEGEGTLVYMVALNNVSDRPAVADAVRWLAAQSVGRVRTGGGDRDPAAGVEDHGHGD